MNRPALEGLRLNVHTSGFEAKQPVRATAMSARIAAFTVRPLRSKSPAPVRRTRPSARVARRAAYRAGMARENPKHGNRSILNQFVFTTPVGS